MSNSQDKPAITIGKPFDELKIPEGMVWKYEVVIRDGRSEHIWVLRNEHGAIHISARMTEWDGRHEWSGGIEVHYATAPDYMDGKKPHHEHCWVLGGPCWHDGSSLYFSERIAPMLPHAYEPWNADDMTHSHKYVLTDLISWHRDKLAPTQNAKEIAQ